MATRGHTVATRDHLFDPPQPKRVKKTWFQIKANKILHELLVDGTIPLNAEEMGPREVYQYDPEFSKWPYENFRTNLNNLRIKARNQDDIAEADHAALLRDCTHYPILTHNAAGVLRWEGSEAEAMMKLDVRRYLDCGATHKEIFASRALYASYGLKRVRGHIHQEIKRLKLNKSHYGTRRL